MLNVCAILSTISFLSFNYFYNLLSNYRSMDGQEVVDSSVTFPEQYSTSGKGVMSFPIIVV